MSLARVQTLIGRTILDRHLQWQLLHGPRDTLFQRFQLTLEEAECLASIQAESLYEFVAEVERRLAGGQAAA